MPSDSANRRKRILGTPCLPARLRSPGSRLSFVKASESLLREQPSGSERSSGVAKSVSPSLARESRRAKADLLSALHANTPRSVRRGCKRAIVAACAESAVDSSASFAATQVHRATTAAAQAIPTSVCVGTTKDPAAAPSRTVRGRLRCRSSFRQNHRRFDSSGT